MFKDLVIKSRSYRKFNENVRIGKDELYLMIDTARYTPSTVNLQALKYKLVFDRDECEKVFSALKFAGLLKGKGTPPEGMRPAAYIIILCDKTIADDLKFDSGIAAQTILLSAAEMGYGGCMLGSVDRDSLFEMYGLDKERYIIELVIALGKPAENIIIEDIEQGESTAYYRDDKGNHYVPKRKTDDLIIE